MRLLNFFTTVLLLILFEYGVQGVSFDYADPNDFKYYLSLGDDVKKLSEIIIGKDVAELCVYGTNYKIDCNTCVCDERTGVTRCTRKRCREGTFSNCIHGIHFMKDCNRCRCSMKTGKTTCTLKKCPNNKNKLAGKCPHGEYYSHDNGCNMCHCYLLSGLSFCTLVACNSIEDELKNKDKLADKCPDGIHFAPNKDGCKNCYCDPNTGYSRCTEDCLKGDEGKLIVIPSKTQLAKNKNLKLKIKEAATGCTPPEVNIIGSCRCDCRLPSVAVCKESCFLDPVG